MTNLRESVGLARDQTRDPWICSQTGICSQFLSSVDTFGILKCIGLQIREQAFDLSSLKRTWPIKTFVLIHKQLTFKLNYSNTCVKRHSKIDKTNILMTNGSLMKDQRIAECSPWSILQCFWPALSYNWSWHRALKRILKTGVQDSHLAKSRSPTGKSGSPTPKKLESHQFVHIVYLFHFSRKWYIWIIFRSTDFNPLSINRLFLLNKNKIFWYYIFSCNLNTHFFCFALSK